MGGLETKVGDTNKIKLDTIGTPAELQQQDLVFVARSNTMSTNDDLIPGPLRGSHKIVIQDLHARTS